METFSALLVICVGNSPVHGEFPAQRPVTLSFDVFFDLWINGWVNNREAGDLKCYRTHYDVIVMYQVTLDISGANILGKLDRYTLYLYFSPDYIQLITQVITPHTESLTAYTLGLCNSL